MRKLACAVLTILLLANLLLTGCRAAPTHAPAGWPTPPNGESGWWNDTVFYEVFVRSFADSDGDGIGDLQGLIGQLDYLNDGDPSTNDDLGVTGMWLMPIMQSPSYHGYDVVDYMTVEEDYGTNDDFRALVAAAHARGIHVIVDLVLNHTSNAHPWFLDASRGPQSPYRDWYVWSATAPPYLGPWGEAVWHPLGGSYYYGIFWSGMPDLNYNNPAVTAQMEEVARFWLTDMGADGFRIDAVRHLIEDGAEQSNTPATHAWLAGFDRFTDAISPDVLTVGEAWDQTRLVAPYVADDELDLVFEFNLAGAIMDSINAGDPQWFAHVLEETYGSYPRNQVATFLTNHDQDRVMSEFGGDAERARLAATLLLTLPGVPFVYYGEEIGMAGQKPDEYIRTPMQWSDGPNAGFTDAAQPWQPVNDDYETVNVAAQSADPDSLLDHYRRLIRLRNEHVALRVGELLPLESTCAPVYGFLRVHDEESVLVLANFNGSAQSGCAFSLTASPLPPGGYYVRDLLREASLAELTVDARGGFGGYVPLATLAPREGAVLLLEPAGR